MAQIPTLERLELSSKEPAVLPKEVNLLKQIEELDLQGNSFADA